MNRKEVYDKYNGRCAYCGDKLQAKWHVDHIQSKRKGGTDHIDNLNPACKLCNMKKSVFDIEEFRNYVKNRIKIFMKYNSDYRLAAKYDLVPSERNVEVKFYFEL